MSNLRFPHLMLEVQDQRFDNTEIENRVSVIDKLIASLPENGKERGGVEAHRCLIDIWRLLGRAQDAFRQRSYGEALTYYEKSLVKVLELLRPTISSSSWEHLVRADPHQLDLVRVVANVSYQLLGDLPMPGKPPWLPDVDALPDALESSIDRFSQHGLHAKATLPSRAQSAIDLGIGYAMAGRPRSASKLFEQALETAGRLTNSQRAALLLNLGAVQLQIGEVEQAARHLKQAQKLFKRAGNMAGEAQTYQNLGVLLEAADKPTQADAQFNTARRLFERSRQVELGSVEVSRPRRSSDPPRPGLQRLATVAGTVRASNVLARPPGRKEVLSLVVPGKGATIAAAYSVALGLEDRGATRKVGVLQGDRVVTLSVNPDRADGGAELLQTFYSRRLRARKLDELTWEGKEPGDLAAELPHLAHFTIPLAIGDCLRYFGRFEAAQERYIQVAGYRFLNPTIEAPALWSRMAENVLAWGDELYRREEVHDALAVYTTLITEEDRAPSASPLFDLPGLEPPANEARAFYADFASRDLDPARRTLILEVRTRLKQIDAGLDFYGGLLQQTPIFTFRYLQDAARLFAQRAVQAEREYIRFQVSADTDAATRDQLVQALERAAEEIELQRERVRLAEAQQRVAEEAESLAATRRQNSEEAKQLYESSDEEEVWLQADLAWYSSQNPWELENKIQNGGADAGKHVHEVMAEKTARLAGIRKERELHRHESAVEEMREAEAMARREVEAAEVQVDLTRKMTEIAETNREHAGENLTAFDQRRFTPELWQRMAWLMRGISRRYLGAAIDIAKRMERAYNFEHDSDLRVIRRDYALEQADLELVADGNLAADALLADIEFFTHRTIINADRKRIRVKQTLSLAERFPFLFYLFTHGDPGGTSSLIRRGHMQFRLPLEDFDADYPGTYGRRLEAVEVEVDGILPPDGAHGRLSIGGLSRFRTLARNSGGDYQQKLRLQTVETQLLSDYRIRNDTLVFRPDPNALGLFEGAGVASSWALDLPPMSNDLDYTLISDVRLVLYYNAFYDRRLDAWIRRRLLEDGDHRRNLSIPLRQHFPDAYFAFQDEAILSWTLTAIDYPLPHQDPMVELIALQLVWEDGGARAVTATLSSPAQKDGIEFEIGADGRVSSSGAGPLASLARGAAVGDYRLEILLADEDRQDLLRLRDVILLHGYRFTPRV